jgi:hypothetical protein
MISAWMQQVILRALEKDPNARPATAGAFISELRATYQSDQRSAHSGSDSAEHEPLNPQDTRPLTTSHTPIPVGPPPRPAPISYSVTLDIPEPPPTFTRADEPAAPPARRRAQHGLLFTAVVGGVMLGGFGLLALSLIGGMGVMPFTTPEADAALFVAESSPEADEPAGAVVATEVSAVPEQMASPESVADLLPPAQFTDTSSPTPRLTRTPTPTSTVSPTPEPTNTPSPTPPPTTPTLSPTLPTNTPTFPAVGLTTTIELRYTPDLFALVNLDETAQDIRSLAFIGAGESDRFVNTSTALGDFLLGRTCILILLSGRSAAVPPEWPCSGSRSVLLNAEQVFWRADSPDDQSFTVSLGAPIAACQTVGRAVSRLGEGVCRIE